MRRLSPAKPVRFEDFRTLGQQDTWIAVFVSLSCPQGEQTASEARVPSDPERQFSLKTAQAVLATSPRQNFSDGFS